MTTPQPASASTTDTVLRTESLTKRYGARAAVDNLDLAVRRGTVYGFLGPNGSGKTTTIGLILGLLAPAAGTIEIFGLDAAVSRSEALRRTGTVLDGQSHFPHLSARDNLRIWARLAGARAEGRIDAMLDLVGLRERARDKVRTYSLGMKQRLGLAVALLDDPDLLILDEPTNGLDPAGIREFRELFQQLAREGKTVFVSSHLLAEVELMCDHVGIIKSGRLLTQGPVSELVRGIELLRVRPTDVARAASVLRALPWVRDVREEDAGLVVEAPHDRAADVSRVLAEAQIYLSELRSLDSTLEDVFLEITGEGDADG